MFSSAFNHLKTVRDLLRFSISQFESAQLFYGHGNANAFDEAAYLILHTLHLPLDKLAPFLDATLLPEEIETVLKIIQKRIDTRQPAAYLTHEAWLNDYRFYVDERVIVPRSFISELLPQSLAPWVDPEQVQHGLDLCTGSACLAIMTADAYPSALIDASDLSLDALEVAQKNVGMYQLQKRINLIHSDLFGQINQTYDIIISNPPYVNSYSVSQLPPEYLHEPTMALGSGIDGLDITCQIIDQAAQFLNSNGVLIVEIGHNRMALEQTYPHLAFTWLSTSQSDDFVFLLTREALKENHER